MFLEKASAICGKYFNFWHNFTVSNLLHFIELILKGRDEFLSVKLSIAFMRQSISNFGSQLSIKLTDRRPCPDAHAPWHCPRRAFGSPGRRSGPGARSSPSPPDNAKHSHTGYSLRLQHRKSVSVCFACRKLVLLCLSSSVVT